VSRTPGPPALPPLPAEHAPAKPKPPIKVGFIGLGRMGQPMSVRLAQAGYDVFATDRDPQRQPDAEQATVRWRPTNAGAAAEADVLITMLPGPDAVTDAMTGRDGALRTLSRGATWIDMSSNDPAVGRTLFDRASEHRIRCLDAPVGGGPPEAANGTLRLFVGGDARDVRRQRPLLETLADPNSIIHVGSQTAGYTTKLLVNLLWFGQAVATAEALLIGHKSGIELKTLRDALAGSAANSDFIRRDVDALFAGNYLTSFGVEGCVRELESITRLADDLEVPHTLSKRVQSVYQETLERFGPVDGELLPVALLEEQAGVELRAPA
jgi:3-hydroxyisobutyrate dehydrogenase